MQLLFNFYLLEYQVSSCLKNYWTRLALSLHSRELRRPISLHFISELLVLRLSKPYPAIVSLVASKDLAVLHIRELACASSLPHTAPCNCFLSDAVLQTMTSTVATHFPPRRLRKQVHVRSFDSP